MVLGVYTRRFSTNDGALTEGRSRVLCFLAQTLRSVTPPPQTIRRLTREALNFLFDGNLNDPIRYLPIGRLLAVDTPSLDIVGEEISTVITGMIDSTDPELQSNGIRLSQALDLPAKGLSDRVGADERRAVHE